MAIGVTKMGHISRLLRAIEKLGEDSEESPMSTPMENSCRSLVDSAGTNSDLSTGEFVVVF